MLFRDFPRQVFQAARVAANRSPALRHLRNVRRFPGMSFDPTVNVNINGEFTYGESVSFGEGCNIIVPAGAALDIGDECYLGRYVEVGPSGRVTLGHHVSIQDRSIIVGDVRVASYCMLSLNVLLTSGRHYFDRWPHLLIRDQDARVSEDPAAMDVHSRPISIEEDCWLGMNSVVMPGITVGRGCVVGANSVVTHDLPPYSVAVGTPARVVRRRFVFTPSATIDWREEKYIPYFYRGFELSEGERRKNASFEGHVARSDFSLWLVETDEVTLRVRSVDAGFATIVHGDKAAEVGNDWCDIRFRTSGIDAPMNFSVSGAGVVVGAACTREAYRSAGYQS